MGIGRYPPSNIVEQDRCARKPGVGERGMYTKDELIVRRDAVEIIQEVTVM